MLRRSIVVLLTVVWAILSLPTLLAALRVNLSVQAEAQAFLDHPLRLDERLTLLTRAEQWLNRVNEERRGDPRLLQHLDSDTRILAQARPDELETMKLYHLGRQEEVTGDVNQAIAYYRRASDVDSHSLAALLALRQIYLNQGEAGAVRAIEEQISGIQPAYRLFISVTANLILTGYDVAETAFAFDAPMPMILYWRVRDAERQNTTVTAENAVGWRNLHTYRVEDRVYQVGEVANLIQNSGFERPTLNHEGVPPGFGEGHTFKMPSAYRQVLLTRDGTATYSACMQNTEDRHRSGITSIPVQMTPGVLHLAGGWIKTFDDAHGQIFVQTYADRYYGHHIANFVVEQKFERDGWAYLAGIVPPSQTDPTYITLWADNSGSGGKVCADNLLLIALPKPVLQ